MCVCVCVCVRLCEFEWQFNQGFSCRGLWDMCRVMWPTNTSSPVTVCVCKEIRQSIDQTDPHTHTHSHTHPHTHTHTLTHSHSIDRLRYEWYQSDSLISFLLTSSDTKLNLRKARGARICPVSLLWHFSQFSHSSIIYLQINNEQGKISYCVPAEGTPSIQHLKITSQTELIR